MDCLASLAMTWIERGLVGWVERMEKHLDTLRQVTDLFLVSADGYSGEQIELFGDVLERLIRTVELRALADVAARIALAEMSTQFASIKQAPPAVVRRLAHNDEISI